MTHDLTTTYPKSGNRLFGFPADELSFNSSETKTHILHKEPRLLQPKNTKGSFYAGTDGAGLCIYGSDSENIISLPRQTGMIYS